MFSRREIVSAITAFPVMVFGGKSKNHEIQKSVILTGNAVERFEEILAKGGEITSMTVYFRLPAPSGQVARGTAFLSRDREECTYRIA